MSVGVRGVKICGVCRPEDARLAYEAGATYVGVILSAQGPRYRDERAAASIFEAAPVPRAGVFVDEVPDRVVELGRRLSLDVVQLHGGEAPAYAAAVRAAGAWQVWKALRLRDALDAVLGMERYRDVVDALLLELPRGVADGFVAFDWARMAAALEGGPRPALWLAGGLRPGNVAAAIERLEPDGVDVSSGVESDPGRKSADAVNGFVAAARSAAARADRTPERNAVATEGETG